MAGLIALVGGDEFRDGCEEMDKAILEAAGVSSPSLVVIPTAAAEHNPSMAASHGVGYFSGLGANASPLMVLEAAHANDEGLLSPIDTADVIYFTGGNPAYLLYILTNSLLLAKLGDALERGAILAGSSAGAMVFGSWMRFREWRQTLGIAPGVAALPHHERADPSVVASELAESAPSGIVVLGIDGKSACLGGPVEWKALGAGGVTVYREGEWHRYTSGEVFTTG